MKNLLILIVAALCLNTLNAQVVFKLSSVSGNKNDNVSIELRTDAFTKIASTEFTISYDSLLMEFNNISDLAPGYDISIGDPKITGKKGVVTMSWNNQDGVGVSFPNNTLLLKLNYKLIGNPCDSNLIKFGKNPLNNRPVEILDENQNPISHTAIDGKVKINGPNCQQGGGGGNDTTFTFLIGKIEVPKGSNGCVPVMAKNFKKINTFQGNLKWDKSIARFTGIGPRKIANFSQVNLSSDSTTLRFLWDDPAGTGVTQPDSVILFEACFDAVGAINSVSELDIISVPGNQIEVTAGGINSTEIPFKIEKGSYKVIAGAQSSLKLYLRDTSGSVNSELCIPVYVDSFTCIGSFQFGVKFDKSKLSFIRVESGAVTVGSNNINIKGDSILLTWDETGGGNLTFPNGSTILRFCFNLLGPCDMTTALSFINLSPTSVIEFSGCNDPVAVRTVGSTITIGCASTPIDCITLSKEDVSCNGRCDGKINMTITGGSNPSNFTYLWLNANNTPVSPAITTKDASKLCPGVYKLQVTDGGVIPAVVKVCIQNTIGEPDPMIITAKINNESQAGNDGKIEVVVTGGSQSYRFKWRRLPNTNLPLDTLNTITGKRCGNYEVMVTDSKGCTLMDTFRIECYVDPPKCSILVIDSIKCFGDCDGSIRSNVQDGRIPFKYKWSTGDTTIGTNNLCAGTYTVTVTDKDGNTCSSSFTLNAPTKISISVTDSTCSNGNNGSINIGVSGGSPGYSFEWRTAPNGPIFATTQNVSGLAAGTFVVKVTDANGCTNTYTTTVASCGGGGNNPTVTLVIELKPGGGGITCSGNCDGKITANASSGTPPYTYKWSHNSQLPNNTRIIENLCAGTYTVTVTDAAGKTSTATTRINDIQALSVKLISKQCASTNIDTDGSYEADVRGGTRPYNYKWCNNETTTVATQLSAGSCSITITDANGCTIEEPFTVCIGTEPQESCFKGNLAISPNGDGYNDFFEIQCIFEYQNTLSIYSRWGQLVYSAEDYINQFKGVDNDGNILNEGTYMYVLIIKRQGEEDKLYKGTVTIVR
ncbi:MAG: gliding motility-associated C-terminal domain-containing protein [Saprospiraceae bacterium]|nr:gliding motility-associated C-terminal domain-containing protein [Saprospiraceae bacterium]